MNVDEIKKEIDKLRDKWSEQAYFLEKIAGEDKSPLSEIHKLEAKILRQCIGELYNVTHETDKNT